MVKVEKVVISNVVITSTKDIQVGNRFTISPSEAYCGLSHGKCIISKIMHGNQVSEDIVGCYLDSGEFSTEKEAMDSVWVRFNMLDTNFEDVIPLHLFVEHTSQY